MSIGSASLKKGEPINSSSVVTRFGCVGFSYRDWMGIFYPIGTSARKQLSIYNTHFDVCELTQFVQQMPDLDRMAQFASQIRGNIKFFVRLHNTFTHCADLGLALSLAKHFKKAFEPFVEKGIFAGFVASFPYAFKYDLRSKDYLEQLSIGLRYEGIPLQMDFRHLSWIQPASVNWLRKTGLSLVCVDEPQMTGLMPPLTVSTSPSIIVRFHGRNKNSWWSGNAMSRYDYLYQPEELEQMWLHYQPLFQEKGVREISFIFNNHWQAQSVKNALDWKFLVEEKLVAMRRKKIFSRTMPQANLALQKTNELADREAIEEEQLRPPVSLPMSEIKSRVSRALFDGQTAFDLPIKAPNK